MKFLPGAGGWAHVQDDEGNRLFVQFADRDGKLRVVGLMVEKYGKAPLVGEDLRRLKLGQIERMANGPAYRDALRARIAVPVEVRMEIDPEAVRVRRQTLPPLPKAKPYPDDFYRKILNAFGALSAPDIAAHYNVDIGRVYGWIQAAREREV